MLKQPVSYAHELLKDYIVKGDHVIDATVGNGNDTLLLAQLVGSSGKVYGFDIQEMAIQNTKEKLLLTGQLPHVKLIQDGHENLDKYLEKDAKVSAVSFNLGYLPKGDKSIITQPDTTLEAISHSLNYLRRGGIITIVVYSGHEGGQEEKSAVDKFVAQLKQDQYNVLLYKYVNQRNNPPFLYVIEKK